jgi:sn-glycerol 3-phosphate transport system permease protein
MAQLETTDRLLQPANVQVHEHSHEHSHWAGQRRGLSQRAPGYLAMLICLLLVGLPIYWMVIGAFKQSAEIYRIPPTWVPLDPTLSNFTKAWNSAPFGRYYVNSFIITFLGSAFEIYFAVTTAYAFAFLRFPRKGWH